MFKDTKRTLVAIGSLVQLEDVDEDQYYSSERKKIPGLSAWKEENLTGLNEHVEYLHTKYMLIGRVLWIVFWLMLPPFSV